jgi:hypothetical protein
VQDRISRRYAKEIAAADHREARAARVDRIDAMLDHAEAAHGRSSALVAALAADNTIIQNSVTITLLAR